MNLVKLSSKGQLVLPKQIRAALGIEPGTILKIARRGHRILIEPVTTSMIDRLYGKYSGEGFLKDLETEHRQELLREDRS
ncbi:MAG: AbrB/MazE/SpoVT family DNA-binding domain-containing protein [Candidatus Methylomirabilota bacterium]|nr:MAG: AbrB/MazE/SpoVT family DNA-binding domain-containing protein [candidate division NC10 bacterium]